eukprot:SAG22_NODE_159_length_16948_cov_14.480503_10_plen_72_part_00
MIEGLGQDNLKLTNALKRIKKEVKGVLVKEAEVEEEEEEEEDVELSNDGEDAGAPYPEVDEDEEGFFLVRT